jgi:hypothetical protein
MSGVLRKAWGGGGGGGIEEENQIMLNKQKIPATPNYVFALSYCGTTQLLKDLENCGKILESLGKKLLKPKN